MSLPTKWLRGGAVALVSTFLIVGAAFAANGLSGPGSSGPDGVTVAAPPQTAEPKEAAEPTETADDHGANSGHDSTEDANDDHGGQSGQGGDDGATHDA